MLCSHLKQTHCNSKCVNILPICLFAVTNMTTKLNSRYLRIPFSFIRSVYDSSAYPIFAKFQDDERVVFSTYGRTGIIKLNKPKEYNPLCQEMALRSFFKLKEWENTKDLFIVKGSNNNFSAGGNLLLMLNCINNKEPQLMQQGYRAVTQLVGFLHNYKLPYVSLMQGFVMGAGAGIALQGKYRVATETSKFAMPETRIGLSPDMGVPYILCRLPNSLGHFLALTGYRLKGFDLNHTGLATHFCLSKFLPELETEILKNPSCVENILQKFQSKSIAQLPNSEEPPFSLIENLEAIGDTFYGNKVEDIIERLHKRGDNFSNEMLKLLSIMSPLSLKISLKVFQNLIASNLDIYEALNQDFRIGLRLLHENDFYQGSRSIVVDKNIKPKWKPERLCDVTDETVQEYFKKRTPECELNLPQKLNHFNDMAKTKCQY